MAVIDICIISPGLLEVGTSRGGGCEVTDLNVALQLSQYFSVVILSPFHESYERRIVVNANLSIEQIPFPALRHYPPRSKLTIFALMIFVWLYSFLIAIKALSLLRKGIKIVVVHNPQTALLSMLLAKMMNARTIYGEGNTTPWTRPHVVATNPSLSKRCWNFLNLGLCKFMCIMVDRIRAQSNSIKEGMVKYGVTAAKIEVIPAGVDSDEFKPIGGGASCDDPIKVAFVGRLVEEKGAPLLLSIVQKAQKELPDARFLIFGDGPYKDYFSKMANVEHLGFVPRNRLNVWLSKAQATLFFQKELGRAELEAMAAGKAIVACNVGETPQVIKHLENGVLCNPDADSYINAVAYLSKNRGLQQKVSEKARETAIKDFSWENVGLRWLSLCREVLADTVERYSKVDK